MTTYALFLPNHELDRSHPCDQRTIWLAVSAHSPAGIGVPPTFAPLNPHATDDQPATRVRQRATSSANTLMPLAHLGRQHLLPVQTTGGFVCGN
jgi:hypothetical protein